MPERSDAPSRLVLVADGQKALFLHDSGPRGRYHLQVSDVLENDNPPTHDQGTDQPGRAMGITGGGSTPAMSQSAVETTDWHRLGKERFAADLAARLDRLVREGKVASLVIVAPPLVLGVLRKAISRETAERVETEIAKDLTGLPVPEIEKALSA